ncbi:MAG: hypothetical protein ACREPB_01110 [Arenimonas sp.]
MKWIHIIAGLLSLITGAIALYSVKGSTWHRKSGMLFAIAMVVMTSSAVLIATFFSPNRVNIVAGSLTFYLVCSGLLTVKRPVEQIRQVTTGFMLLAFTISAYAFSLGLQGLDNPKGIVDKVPMQAVFMFATVGLTGAILDARMLLAGSIQGAHRLARHLWRMSFAMWIATMSFFLGQAKFFPDPIRKSGLLTIPVLMVLAIMLYWLVRVLWKGKNPAMLPASLKEDGVDSLINT